MTGLERNIESSDGPNVQALGNAMSTAIQKFAKCNQIQIDNSYISEKIKEIKEHSINFQTYVNDSISQSDKLSKYAEEIVVFAVAWADTSFTKEELLEFLKLTLEDAKKNKTEVEILKANISGIMANLTNIQNECVRYSHDIQRDARMMNSNTVNQLENKEFKQKCFDITCKFGAGAAIFGGAASLIAAPFTGGASLAIPVVEAIVEGGLIVAGTTSAIAVGSKFASHRENNGIADLSLRLIKERDGLVPRIDLLNGDLGSIISESVDIINFWDEQVSSLNELVERLERYDNQDGDRPSRLTTLTIQKKWNHVSKDCKEYNRTIRAALQMSEMIPN